MDRSADRAARELGNMTARVVVRKDGSAITMIGKAILAEKPARRRTSRRDRGYSIELHRLREIESIIKARHGKLIPDGRETDDYELCVAYVRCAALTLSEQNMHDWAFRFAPWLEAEAVEEFIKEARKRRRMMTADGVAGLLRVTWDERQKLGLRTIGACDMTKDERKAVAFQRKRDKDRKAKAEKRKAEGRQSRASYEANSLSKQKPWELEGISRSTYYRRRKTSVALIDINKNGDTPVSKGSDAIPAVPPPSTSVQEQVPCAKRLVGMGLGTESPIRVQGAKPHGT